MELVHTLRGRPGSGRVAGVCRLLEAAAGEHAAALGVGIDALRAGGRAWMLVRLGLRAARWPEPGEEVEVLTWPSRRTAGARAWREFEVRDAAGCPLLEAASVWLIVDLERRRPVRLPGFLHQLPFPARDTSIEFVDPPDPGAPPGSISIRRIEPSHIDINLHVNNVAWIAWAEEEADLPHPARLQADFLAEARQGETVVFHTWRDCHQRRALQTASAGGRPCVRLQWW